MPADHVTENGFPPLCASRVKVSVADGWRRPADAGLVARSHAAAAQASLWLITSCSRRRSPMRSPRRHPCPGGRTHHLDQAPEALADFAAGKLGKFAVRIEG